MSDFEYEYNSSSDNDDNISDNISDINYSDDELNSDTIKNNFIIDMDNTMDDTMDNTIDDTIDDKIKPILICNLDCNICNDKKCYDI